MASTHAHIEQSACSISDLPKASPLMQEVLRDYQSRNGMKMEPSPATTRNSLVEAFGAGLPCDQQQILAGAINDAMTGQHRNLSRLALPENSQAAAGFHHLMNNLGYSVDIKQQTEKTGNQSTISIYAQDGSGGLRLSTFKNPQGGAAGGVGVIDSQHGTVKDQELRLSSRMLHALMHE